MPEMVVLNRTGRELNEITPTDTVFDIELNQQYAFDTVIIQRAFMRQGTHDTKGRVEVHDGGRRPWRQKGTRRARQGSICATQWKGGGIIFGSTPRNYGYKLNRKVHRLALKPALSEKMLESAMSVIDKFELEAPKSKVFNQTIASISAPKKTLFVVSEGKGFENAFLSMRDIPTTMMLIADGLSVYNTVNTNKVIFTEAIVKDIEEVLA